MDNLTQQQYEKVLKYMEDYNQDNFQHAYKIMQQCNFDMEICRAKKNQQNRDRNANMGRQRDHGQLLDNQNQNRQIRAVGVNNNGRNNQNYQELFQQQQQEQITKMRTYLLRRAYNRRRINKLARCGQCISNLCIKFTQNFVPQLIKRKVIRSNFYQRYQDQSVIQLRNKNLEQTIKLCRSNKKKAFVIISENGKNHCILEFLKKKKLLSKIEQNFQVLGVIDTQFTSQFKQLYPYLPSRLFVAPPASASSSISSSTSNSTIKTQSILSNSQKNNSFIQLSTISPPCILILRQRHTQDLQLIEQYYGQSQILGIDEKVLSKLQQKIKANMDKQSALLRRITQKLLQESYQLMGFPNQQQQRNNNQNQAEIQSPQEVYLKNRRQSAIIAQQNKQYLQMQSKKLQNQKLEKQKKQQLQNYLEQRKCRKLSLPQQPIQQDPQQIIKIIFRCPNGENINRKFKKDQKCQILYNWVQLNDEIQFQSQQCQENSENCKDRWISQKNERKNSRERVIVKERKFDLLFSYPPESLKQKMGMLLSQVFQGQQQVKLLIRQQ